MRQKGFIEEKELVKLCLLPQRNIRAIVNRLITDGMIQTQELSMKGSSGYTGLVLMYGVNMQSIYQKMGYNV